MQIYFNKNENENKQLQKYKKYIHFNKTETVIKFCELLKWNIDNKNKKCNCMELAVLILCYCAREYMPSTKCFHARLLQF